jgi:hypothetical protein
MTALPSEASELRLSRLPSEFWPRVDEAFPKLIPAFEAFFMSVESGCTWEVIGRGQRLWRLSVSPFILLGVVDDWVSIAIISSQRGKHECAGMYCNNNFLNGVKVSAEKFQNIYL